MMICLPSRVPMGSCDPLLGMPLVESDAYKHRVMQRFGRLVKLCRRFLLFKKIKYLIK